MNGNRNGPVETILITGAGRGLGRALALALAAPGRALALVARTRDELEDTASRVREAGARAVAIVDDVGDPAAAPRIAGRAMAGLGRVDVLVHNASDLGPLPMPLLADTDPDALRRVFAVNTFGPFALTRALVGAMLLQGRGQVVQISSDAATEAYPNWGAYGASKAAADHLARVWAAELADTPIAFVTVDPGEMDTQMHTDAMPDADRSRLARPEDVARALARLITGKQAPTGRVALTEAMAS